MKRAYLRSWSRQDSRARTVNDRKEWRCSRTRGACQWRGTRQLSIRARLATCTHRRPRQEPPPKQLKSAKTPSTPHSATESASFPSRSKLWGRLDIPRVASFLTWRLASALEPAKKASAGDLIANSSRLSRQETPHASSSHMGGRPTRRAHNNIKQNKQSFSFLFLSF